MQRVNRRMNNPYHYNKPPIAGAVLNLKHRFKFQGRKIVDKAAIRFFPESEYAVRRKRVWANYQRIMEIGSDGTKIKRSSPHSSPRKD